MIWPITRVRNQGLIIFSFTHHIIILYTFDMIILFITELFLERSHHNHCSALWFDIKKYARVNIRKRSELIIYVRFASINQWKFIENWKPTPKLIRYKFVHLLHIWNIRIRRIANNQINITWVPYFADDCIRWTRTPTIN